MICIFIGVGLTVSLCRLRLLFRIATMQVNVYLRNILQNKGCISPVFVTDTRKIMEIKWEKVNKRIKDECNVIKATLKPHRLVTYWADGCLFPWWITHRHNFSLSVDISPYWPSEGSRWPTAGLGRQRITVTLLACWYLPCVFIILSSVSLKIHPYYFC